MLLADTNLIDGGLSIGEMFGFAGLVATMLLFALGYGGYTMLNTWKTTQENTAASNIASHSQLVAIQTESYKKHIEFAQSTQQAVVRITESTEQTHKLLESLANGSLSRQATEARIAKRVTDTERVIRECIRLFANQPETSQAVKEGLQRILERARDEE
jgi:hypothetical protein